MYQPAHVDGRSVVILRKDRRGFHVLEKGRLSYDGQELLLILDTSQRPFTESELDALMPVAAGSRIAECRGFDFFLLAEAPKK